MIPEKNKIYNESSLELLKKFDDDIFDCSISSPPYYGQRDYHDTRQIGYTGDVDTYLGDLVDVYHQVNRCLTDIGTMIIVITDIRIDENLQLIPMRLVQRLQEKNRDMVCRQFVIWEKPNPPPFPVYNNFVDNYEYVIRLSKTHRTFFLQQYEPYETDISKIGNIKFGGTKSQLVDVNKYSGRTWEPNPKGRQKRAVWRISKSSVDTMHCAVYAEELVQQIINAHCPPLVCIKCGDPAYDFNQVDDEGKLFTKQFSCQCKDKFRRGMVLDPFMGSGTTGLVALNNRLDYVGIELNEYYARSAAERIHKESLIESV